MGLSLMPRNGGRLQGGQVATPLLAFLAGDHAERIASVWHAPHTDFFAMPSARRHAAAVLLHRLVAGDFTGRASDIAMAVERARDKDVATLLAGEPQPGLMKAMGRLGETLWCPVDYDRFLGLFAEDQAGQILRHMKVVEASQLALICELPVALRQPNIVGMLPGQNATQDLAKAHKLVIRLKGEGARVDVASRWGRAKTVATLFDMAAEDLRPVDFGSIPAVPVLPAPFEAVVNRKQLEATARQFQNCLRDFVADIARGQMAVFIWRGDPAAVVALRSDPAGWRLAEVDTRGNCGIDDAPLREIINAVVKAGVRTGPSVWTLAKRLHCYGCKSCGPVYRDADVTWRDALELGELWD